MVQKYDERCSFQQAKLLLQRCGDHASLKYLALYQRCFPYYLAKPLPYMELSRTEASTLISELLSPESDIKGDTMTYDSDFYTPHTISGNALGAETDDNHDGPVMLSTQPRTITRGQYNFLIHCSKKYKIKFQSVQLKTMYPPHMMSGHWPDLLNLSEADADTLVTSVIKAKKHTKLSEKDPYTFIRKHFRGRMPMYYGNIFSECFPLNENVVPLSDLSHGEASCLAIYIKNNVKLARDKERSQIRCTSIW